jgi:hypothetical protein
MNTNDNMLSTFVTNVELKNKGFLLLDSLFKENGWHMTKNEMDLIEYTKLGDETNFFQIKVNQRNIHVSVPIKNSPYQYKTSFDSYFDASDYVEKRFNDFCN